MDSYRKKIDQLQQEMEEKLALIVQDRVAIGSYLLRNEPEALSSKKLAEQKSEAKRLESQIEAQQKLIQKINTIIDQQQRIDNDIENHQEEIASLEESIAPMYEEIGKQAFDIYKANPFVDQKFVDMFSELVKNQEDIRDIDQQLAQLEKETEEKPFLDRMVAKGRIALLRNRRTTREQNTPRLLRRAGKAVTESNFVTVVDAPSLTKTLEPYHQTHTKIDQVRRTVGDLESERATLEERLTELDADRKTPRRISEIEQQIETLRSSLETVYQATGDIYIAELKKEDEPLAPIAEAVKRVMSLEKERAALEKQIERLRAAIAADEAAERVGALQKKIAALEEKIAEQQSTVVDYRSQLAELEAEKARLEKQRGPLDKL